ncbi:protein phosphatase 2C domain-containing protein [Chryseobacterium vaccae]|uniref:protein phosphatase 2C domain-containing protein n=1 Tax=Chryseobacterium vaccae TaxID=2604424 RepID=UPI001294B30E|nr:protein phosphatase 2C domain-containing protein [Chryseobacterium vaccae]
MNIYSALQIGDYHTNQCEDHLVIRKTASDKIICAVMDGCSTALESHFASVLTGKIIRKAAIEKSYKDLYEAAPTSIDEELKEIIQSIFEEMSFAKKQLMLDEKELLTTLIILFYNFKENKGGVLTIGDGVICINGEITEYDRDNKPDYLAYHLHEDFNDWYFRQQQKIFFEDLKDISIATDGILTFTQVKKANTEDKINFAQYLMTDLTYSETEEMLNRKLKHLEQHYGVKPTDDLAMIRMIL